MNYTNPVLGNPFRLLGLYGNAKNRDLVRQSTRLPQFLEVGQDTACVADFMFLGPLERNLENVQEATRRLENPRQRIHHSLFWFVTTDELQGAVQMLESGNVSGAMGEFRARVSDEEEFDLAAAVNLSTIVLSQSVSERAFERKGFEEAIRMKARVLASPDFVRFAETLNVGVVQPVSNDDIVQFVENIIDGFVEWIDNEGGITSSDLISLLEGVDPRFSEELLAKFAGGPAQQIDNEVRKAQKLLESDPWDADNIGEELYEETKKQVVALRRVLGPDNIQTETVTNKLALQLNHCARVFFDVYGEDIHLDPGQSALRLLKYAKAYRPTGDAAERITEGEGVVRTWIREARLRGKGTGLESEFLSVRKKLIAFLQRRSGNSTDAMEFLQDCYLELDKIKKTLGEDDDAPRNISSRVANAALSMSVGAVNEVQAQLVPGLPDFRLMFVAEQIKGEVSAAYKMILICETLPLEEALQGRLKDNKTILTEILTSLRVFPLPSRPSLPSYKPPVVKVPTPTAAPRKVGGPVQRPRREGIVGKLEERIPDNREKVLNWAIGIVAALILVLLIYFRLAG